jgi:hypothetical protein
MLCSKCEKGSCNYFSQENSPCEEYVTCTCQCNVEGFHDAVQKISAIGGGLLGVAFGIGVAVGSGGLLAMAGGTMAGAGFSSFTKGIEKTWKKEKIETKDYLLEVGFGAVTGVCTGGIGAVGEAATVQVTKEAIKETVKVSVKKIAVRTVAGASAGVTAKFWDETKQCTKDEKDWNKWGKSLDEQDKEKGALATAGSWLGSGLLGGIGGGISHISSGLSSQVENKGGQFATKIIVETAGNTGVDLGCQVINNITGEQEGVDLARIATTAGTTVSSVIVREAATKIAIELKGGEEKVLERQKMKAKVTNKKTQEKVANLGDKLREPVNDMVLTEQKERIKTYQNERFQEEKTFKEKINFLKKEKLELEVHRKDVLNKIKLEKSQLNKGEVRALGKEINSVDQKLRQKRNEIGNIWRKNEDNTQRLARNNPAKEKIGKNNIHFRRAGGYKQVVVDIGEGKKAFFDFDETSGKHKFVDLVSDRDYSKVPNYGESPNYEISELEYQEPSLNRERKKKSNDLPNFNQTNDQNSEVIAESENQNEVRENADKKVTEEELEQAEENQVEAKIEVPPLNQKK